MFNLLVLFAIFIIGLLLRYEALDGEVVNSWVKRDFYRAFNLVDGNYILLAGPEMTNSGRLSGPFLYSLQVVPGSTDEPRATTILL